MKKKLPRSLFVLAFVLLILLSLSKTISEKCCGTTIAYLAPLWESLFQTKIYIQSFFGYDLIKEEQMQQLQLENRMLWIEINQTKDLLKRELELQKEWEILSKPIKESSERHIRELEKMLKRELDAVPARVIFRSPTSWNSSFWVNVGESHNQTLGRTAIAKNSPVVVGHSVVGVVEYVGEKQSRVRLITDSGLTPSVRVKRSIGNETYYLAKGELQGSGKPIWRTGGTLLKGVGFNYEFADAEGPARELRTGQPVTDQKRLPPLPIIQVTDLLVTSGMDGVFPAGLQVATITKIKPLEEGDYYYEIEAMPTAGNMDSLDLVFILSPN